MTARLKCQWCGREFPVRVGGRWKFCTPQCSRAKHNKTKRVSHSNREALHLFDARTAR